MRAPRHFGQNAFTIIELLVVVSIIAVLIAILLPAISQSRYTQHANACKANLRQIGLSMIMYAQDNKLHFPDKATQGNEGMRQGYSTIWVGNSTAAPETYGMPALLDTKSYLDGTSKVWICPAQRQEIKAWGNTYEFSVAANLATKNIDQLGQPTASGPTLTIIAWDAYTSRPFVTGVLAPTSGTPVPPANSLGWTTYSIATADRFVPHDLKTGKRGQDLPSAQHLSSTQGLWADGRVGTR